MKLRVRVWVWCGLVAVMCAGCADPSQSQAASASPQTSSPAPIPSAKSSPAAPETVAEYLASQGIEVSGRPDFEGKGAADQYAGTYLMIKGEHTSGVWAQFNAGFALPSFALECDPTCSEGPTTTWREGTTPQDSWSQTMVVHGPDTNRGVEGTRVIERAYDDGVRIALEIPPWEGQSTPSLTLDQADGLLDAAMAEYLRAPKPPPNRAP
jgi:hypothetical protein